MLRGSCLEEADLEVDLGDQVSVEDFLAGCCWEDCWVDVSVAIDRHSIGHRSLDKHECYGPND